MSCNSYVIYLTKMRKNLRYGCQRNRTGFRTKERISGFRLLRMSLSDYQQPVSISQPIQCKYRGVARCARVASSSDRFSQQTAFCSTSLQARQSTARCQCLASRKIHQNQLGSLLGLVSSLPYFETWPGRKVEQKDFRFKSNIDLRS